MSNQILLPLETFAHEHRNNMTSEYSDNCAKDELRTQTLSIGKDVFHSQDQSNSSKVFLLLPPPSCTFTQISYQFCDLSHAW